MRKLLLSILLLVGLASQALAADNYAATAGSGLTFGAKDAAGVLYSRFIVCDNTTVSQCLAVDASGRLSIIPNTAINIAQINGVTVLMGNGATGTGSQRVTLANDNTIPTGWPTAANQTTTNASIGTTADAACGTPDGTCSLIALTKYNNTATNSSVPAGTNLIGDVNVRQGGTALSATNPLPVAGNPYPVGAVPYTATATGTTAATTATLAGAASVTTYICGFSIRANATAAATGNATVTGVITATMNFTQWTAPLASGLGITEMIFAPCIPASAANTSVAVVSAAPGAGGTVSVSAWGYKL